MADKVLNPFIMYLREQLTCPMCRGILNSPRTLPCLHNVCHECLKLLEAKSRQQVHNESPIQCPACSLEIDTSEGFTVTELPISFYVERLKEIVNVTNNNFDVLCRRCKLHPKHVVACCFQCKSPICRSCVNAHKQTKALKSHEVCHLSSFDIKRLPELLQGPVLCNEHNGEEIEFFCEECLVCVCNTCLQMGTGMHSHIEHVGKVRPLKGSSEASKQRILSALGIIKKNTLVCREEIKRVDQSYRTMERKLIDARQDVHKKVEDMISALKNHEKEMVSELDSVYKDHQSAILRHRRRLQHATEGMRRAQEDVKRVLERNLPVEISMLEDPVAKHFLRLLDDAEPDSSPVKCINADYLTVEELSSVFSGSSRLGEVLYSYTDPSSAVVEGESFHEKKVLAGERMQFAVVTRDSEGKMSYSENDCPAVNIHVDNGTTDGKVIPARIEDCANGKYLVSYTPFQAGMYKIEICVRGESIQGSPFHIKALTRAQPSNPSSPTTKAVQGKSNYRAVVPFGELRFKPVQLKGPRGVAVSSRGEIAVADSGNRRVQVFTAEGEFLTQFGGPQQSDQAILTNPVGVAFDINGNLLVSDCDSRQIYTFSREGLLVQEFGLDSLEYPMGMCATREGNITVCDWGSRSVKEFSADGKLLQEFSYIPIEHHRSGIPARPYFVCQQKESYLASMEIGCVCAFDKQGHFLYTVTGKTGPGQEKLKLKEPRGLTVDSNGNLIVCDSGHHRLHIFTPDGRTILLGDQGRELGQFDRVQDVVAAQNGKLYVADLGNDRVQVFQ